MVRGNRGRSNGVSAKQQIVMLKRQMHGHKNNLRHAAPPQITQRPWYPLIVDFVKVEAGVEVLFTPSDIINSLASQLGLPSQASSIINIKLHRVDLYAMAVAASTDRPAVSMDVSAVTPSIGDPVTPGSAEVFYSIIKKLSDQGNLSEAAKCSYTWPSHMADQPLSSQSVFTVVASSANVPNALTRFHVLWSSTDIASPV
jgi:hypothetical protein